MTPNLGFINYSFIIIIIMYFEYEKAILSTLSQCEIIKVYQLVCWNKESMKT